MGGSPCFTSSALAAYLEASQGPLLFSSPSLDALGVWFVLTVYLVGFEAEGQGWPPCRSQSFSLVLGVPSVGNLNGKGLRSWCADGVLSF